MSEDGPTKSFDDIFAKVSRLGRDARTAEEGPETDDGARPEPDARIASVSGTIERVARSAGTRDKDKEADDGAQDRRAAARAEAAARQDAQAEQERRAALRVAEAEAARLRERAQSEERARIAAAAAEEERRAAARAAAQADADARAAARLEEDRRSALRSAELEAARARERALADEQARAAAAAAAAQAQRQIAEQVAAKAAHEARERARAEEARRAAQQAVEQAADRERARVLAEEQARIAAAEKKRRAEERAAAQAEHEALERARAEERVLAAAAAAEDARRVAREAAQREAARLREQAEAAERARLDAAAADERRAVERAAAQAEEEARERRRSEERVVAEPPAPVVAVSAPAEPMAVDGPPGAPAPRRRRVVGLAVAAVALVMIGGGVFLRRGDDEPRIAALAAPPGPPAAATRTAPPAPDAPRPARDASLFSAVATPASAAMSPPLTVIHLVAEPSNHTAQWLGRALNAGSSRSSSAAVALDVLPRDGWLASVQALAVQPRMTVLRYEVLQAARNVPRSVRVPDLEVIAPIGAEPLLFVVRTDSSLHFVHELRGRAINVGAAAGARALTARDAYHRLFAAWPSSSASTALDEDAALDRLMADRSLDAVAVVGATPQSPLARRFPLASHGLRVLALDDRDPADQRLLATYLPIPLTDPAVNGGRRMTTPGVVSFLVTAAGASGDSARQDDFIRTAAASLCGQWSALGASRVGLTISPKLQPDVGWPYANVAQEPLTRCASQIDLADAGTPSTQSPPP